jgi:hypothetical protein
MMNAGTYCARVNGPDAQTSFTGTGLALSERGQRTSQIRTRPNRLLSSKVWSLAPRDED